jgi:hypothetical protein
MNRTEQEAAAEAAPAPPAAATLPRPYGGGAGITGEIGGGGRGVARSWCLSARPTRASRAGGPVKRRRVRMDGRIGSAKSQPFISRAALGFLSLPLSPPPFRKPKILSLGGRERERERASGCSRGGHGGGGGSPSPGAGPRGGAPRGGRHQEVRSRSSSRFSARPVPPPRGSGLMAPPFVLFACSFQPGGAALSEAAAARRGGGGGGCRSRRGGGAGIRVPGEVIRVDWCRSARVPFWFTVAVF